MFARNFAIFLGIWTLVIGTALWTSHIVNEKIILRVAYAKAEAYFTKDVIFRSWASEHGGVYAPITEKSPANPYLSGIEERDISTPSGKKLTLINPAYMNRQLYELSRKKFNIHSHITSLNPIRLENKADVWETRALKRFTRNKQEEVYAVTRFQSEPHFRFMRPLYVEKNCLKCHAYQGYRIGDVRGGISVSIPMADIRRSAGIATKRLYGFYGLLWFGGLILFMFRKKCSSIFFTGQAGIFSTDGDNASRHSENMVLLTNFSIIFFPSFVVISLILCIPLLFGYKSQIEILKNSHNQYIEDMRESVFNDLRGVASDVQMLASYPDLLDFIENNDAQRQQLEKSFLSFSMRKGLYDQVRFIDSSGDELIRIDYRRGMPAIAMQAQLQNKRHRYYFVETLKLGKGQVYISPMDLNIENKEIEKPLKPMMRFATPVFDRKGDKRGILIVNYLSERLIYDLVKRYHFEEGMIMLINNEGYWLKGETPADEWGFMYPDKKDLTFKKRYPQIWNKLLLDEHGQYYDESGLFTFSSVFPQLEIANNHLPDIDPFPSRPSSVNARRQGWKIISFVPEESMTKLFRKLFINSLPFYIVVVIILAFTCWRLTVYRQFKVKTNQKLRATLAQVKELSVTDELTSLHNRRHFNQCIGKELLRAQRNRQRLVFCIFDIDFFKLYNDCYGHQAGDMVLKSIGLILKEKLSRASDYSFRLGGEEFGILAAIEKQDSTFLMIELIREAIENKKISHAKNKVSKFVTASFGCFIIEPDSNYTAEEIYECADKALYKAKEQGRNRVVFY